jgi:hypothetical protein
MFETLVVGGWQSLIGGPRMEVLMSKSTSEDLQALGALVDSVAGRDFEGNGSVVVIESDGFGRHGTRWKIEDRPRATKSTPSRTLLILG